MQKVKAEVGFVRGISVGEDSGLLLPGGAPGPSLGQERQDTDCEKKANCACKVYTSRLKLSHSSSWESSPSAQFSVSLWWRGAGLKGLVLSGKTWIVKLWILSMDFLETVAHGPAKMRGNLF